jgi:Enolase C-terminal domain-like/FAD binding domain
MKLDYFRRLLEVGAVDVLQVDASRCCGIIGLLKIASLAEAYHIPISSHCAPSIHLHPACALTGFRHAEYFYDHVRIEERLFEGVARPINGCLQPDLSRPGIGLEFKKKTQKNTNFASHKSKKMQATGRSNARSTTLGVRPSSTNLKALIQELERRTKGEVRFDEGSRALYSTDSSNYRQTPIGVVLPSDQEDVVETVAVCRNFGVPITGRGAGTSLAGQCCNVAVILDFSKYCTGCSQSIQPRSLHALNPA